MAGVRDGVLARSIGTLYEAGASIGLADAQLLERAASGRGEASASAFEAIVARHGPMVLGVCRRALDDPHDAQDAFQATFLVLARRAGSIRDGEVLASWLFGVARRVCDRARTDLVRRRLHERRAAERAGSSDRVDDHRDLEALHEEVARLPERYRLPVVLCYLEGLTYEAAADRLRCPLGTLSIRLSRARDRLRSRLLRRGLTASAGLLAASTTASAGISEGLAAETSRLALRSVGDRAMGIGEVPAAVAGLARGVLDVMRTTARIKVLAGIFGLAAIAAGALASGGRGADDAPKAEAAPSGDLARLQGTWDWVEPPGGVVKAMSWRVDGSRLRMTWEDGNREPSVQTAAIRLDERAMPRAIDTILDIPDHKTITERGIYTIEGDTLTVCIGRISDRRPAEFRNAAGDVPARLLVLRRRIAPERPADPPADDLARLRGTWIIEGRDPSIRLTFRGADYTSTFEGGAPPPGRGTVTLDLKSSPRQIDFASERGPHTFGIYLLKGDTLGLHTLGPFRDGTKPGRSELAGLSTAWKRLPEVGDLGKIQGSWVAEGLGPGKDVTFELAIAGDVVSGITTTPSRTSRSEFTIALDESARPREFETATREPKPMRMIGIYRLDGDTLTMRFGAPDRPRPTEFSAEEGQPFGLVVFKRKAAP